MNSTYAAQESHYVKGCRASEPLKEAHQEFYSNVRYYSLKFELDHKVLNLPFSSSKLKEGNIASLVIDSLLKGKLISLQEITMIEYAKAGGADVPHCLKQCLNGQKRGYPKCLQK
jgi:hypothetical protein